ncbi:MAG: tetratricopeptide repeat protein [Bacteroidales bacterium]|nr:tetratricopeptide repeat protein [Bacteroidales bacterium]
MKKSFFLTLCLITTYFSYCQWLYSEQSSSSSLLKIFDLENKNKFSFLRNPLVISPNQSNMLLEQKIAFLEARSAYELLNNDAIYLLKSFIQSYPVSMHLNYAFYYLGQLYYREKKWKDAVTAYEKCDVQKMNEDEKLTTHFKAGYAYFNLNQYDQARTRFLAVKDIPSPYQNHSIYFYSHIQFTENKHETALQGFLQLTRDSFYANIVPFYISQIYFYQKRYDDLINYASPLFEKLSSKRKDEIAKMLMYAWYQKGKYSDALNYAHFIDQNKSKLNPNETYLEGYIFYANQNYPKAIEYFTKISKENDSLYQQANYHLGFCYVQTNQKKFALNSFYEAYQFGKDSLVREDALFHFVKLSYELDYYPFNNAMKALESYLSNYPTSPRAEEARTWLAKILMSTGDYAEAVQQIKKIKTRTPEMSLAYQKANLYLAFQYYNQQDYNKAKSMFFEVLKNNFDRSLYARALFWIGEVYFIQNDFDSAKYFYTQFIQYPPSEKTPEYARGWYGLGYVLLKQKKYEEAANAFNRFLQIAKGETPVVLTDAQLRLADCYFKQKKYQQAKELYESAYKKKLEQTDYALYQLAMIDGAQNNTQGKINSMNLLIEKYPKSNLRPLAIYEVAITYELLNQNDKAIQYYQKLIQDYPDHAIKLTALVKLGSLYRNIHQREKAIEIFKQIIEEYPSTDESRQAWVILKNIYTEMDQLDAFFDYVSHQGKSISEQEKDSLIYQAAENKFMDGDCNGAIQGFTSYLNQYPQGSYAIQAHFYRAECLYGQKKFQDALKDYESVLQFPLSNFQESALLKAARIHFNLANFAKANEYYTALEKITTSQQIIQECQKNILHGLFALNQFEASIQLAQRIIQTAQLSETDLQQTKITLARAYIEIDRYGDAKQVLQPLTKLKASETGAMATYYLAYIYYKENKYTDAENTVFDLINKYASYEDWVARAFILLGDVYTATGNYYQAKFALQSVIDNYQGEDLVNEAREKLKNVIEIEQSQK